MIPTYYLNSRKLSCIILIGILLCGLLVASVCAWEPDWGPDGSGYVTTNGTDTIRMWNTTGTHYWLSNGNATSVTYLVVGGGGGAGISYGGGGGAGGFSSAAASSVSGLTTIIVGSAGSAGTSGVGGDGGNSQFGWGSTEGTNKFIGYGGGGGGTNTVVGNNGGSGGGGGNSAVGGAATQPLSATGGYGQEGGSNSAASGGAGGGGASESGYRNHAADTTTGGNGGSGRWSTITGTNTIYAGGGGGGMRTTYGGKIGTGGAGGGGDGGADGAAGHDAIPNTGGGGGASGGEGTPTGAGGSGIVVIRYTTPASTTPVASFTPIGETPGVDNKSVQFTNTSTGALPMTCNWSRQGIVVGNNTKIIFSSNCVPPRVSFDAGNHSISLNVTNAYGYNESVQDTWVNVSSLSVVEIPIVQWVTDKVVVIFPGKIKVNDTSLNTPTSWRWVWGDGTAQATEQNTSHQFLKRGLWNVNLTATNAAGSNTSATQSIRVMGFQGLPGPVEECTYTSSRVLDVYDKMITDCKICGRC